ncbi:hypothetical protein QJQ45_030291 [Haematococcus lacustris]|nr:hypothetical protein QJQ45_030291 [Haematococcus lacustris]
MMAHKALWQLEQTVAGDNDVCVRFELGARDALCGTELMARQAQWQLEQTVTACWSRTENVKISLDAFFR